MNDVTKYSLTVRRAALPEVMFGPDLALAVGVCEQAADTAAREGRLGRPFYVGGRVAVLRQDFLRALTRKAKSAKSKEVLP